MNYNSFLLAKIIIMLEKLGIVEIGRGWIIGHEKG